MASVFIGCAGWSLPSRLAAEFSVSGTHLERYAARFNAVEINSSFYRPHRQTTYARWAATTPQGFRFAVKMPREITHERRLDDVASPLAEFLDSILGLGEKLGPLLVQLPPSLEFDRRVAGRFFRALRNRVASDIVCEPRHASWFSPPANELLESSEVARVTADPLPVKTAMTMQPSTGLRYFRWHGSPKMYYSSYSLQQLGDLAAEMRAAVRGGKPAWCIFDNTALGAALENGLELRALVADQVAR